MEAEVVIEKIEIDTTEATVLNITMVIHQVKKGKDMSERSILAIVIIMDPNH